MELLQSIANHANLEKQHLAESLDNTNKNLEQLYVTIRPAVQPPTRGCTDPYSCTKSVWFVRRLYAIPYDLYSLLCSCFMCGLCGPLPAQKLGHPVDQLLRLLYKTLHLTFSLCLYPVSVGIQVCVSSPPIDLSFITLGKVKTLISLSLKVNK